VDFNWVWQGILTNWLADLLVLGAGIMLALAKAKNWGWASPALYGLGGCASMAVLLFALLNFPAKRITTDNIEGNIRSWLTSFGYGFVPLEPCPIPAHFCLRVTLPSGRPVNVIRPNQLDHYIVFIGEVTVSPEHQALLTRMSHDEATRVTRDIGVELAQFKLGFNEMGVPVQAIELEKRVPITNAMTEDAFLQSVGEMDTAELLAIQTLLRDLRQ
jgi:hypothetical protein